MLHGHHYQNAYITRDLDKALARFGKQLGRSDFATHHVNMQITTPRGAGEAVMTLSLIWVDDLQYEFIQPISGFVDLYMEALPDDDSIKFHHIAARVDDWDSFRARVAADGLTVAQEGGGEALKFLYLDMRDLLGHYVEYCWATPESWAAMGAPWAAK